MSKWPENIVAGIDTSRGAELDDVSLVFIDCSDDPSRVFVSHEDARARVSRLVSPP